MTKKEWESTLMATFETLPDIESGEVLAFYNALFDEKMSEGISEEEIVASFGDPIAVAHNFIAGYQRELDRQDMHEGIVSGDDMGLANTECVARDSGAVEIPPSDSADMGDAQVKKESRMGRFARDVASYTLAEINYGLGAASASFAKQKKRQHRQWGKVDDGNSEVDAEVPAEIACAEIDEGVEQNEVMAQKMTLQQLNERMREEKLLIRQAKSKIKAVKKAMHKAKSEERDKLKQELDCLAIEVANRRDEIELLADILYEYPRTADESGKKPHVRIVAGLIGLISSAVTSIMSFVCTVLAIGGVGAGVILVIYTVAMMYRMDLGTMLIWVSSGILLVGLSVACGLVCGSVWRLTRGTYRFTARQLGTKRRKV